MKPEIVTASPQELGILCDRYGQAGYRLVTMVATDERELRGSFVLRYFMVAGSENEILECQTVVPATDPSYASVTPFLPAADWYEREAFDLMGLQPTLHPNAEPLVLHGTRIMGAFPLRKDFLLQETLLPVQRPVHQANLDEGQFEVPVGPIHAGVIEPGHFRFRVHGEDVESMSAHLFYTHRGLEKRAQGMDLEEGIALAQQTCGVCSVSHALSYAQAVEALAQVEISPLAKLIRVVMGELERLYNHVGDIGNICAGIGFSFGVMQCGRLKETLQQLNDDVTGHRYLRGVIGVGGVLQTLSKGAREHIGIIVDQVNHELAPIVDAILSHEIVCDRFRNTGVLTQDVVRRLGVVGPAARASGVRRDVRIDHPYAGYETFALTVPIFASGDVMTRLEQRIAEYYVSAALVAEALQRLRDQQSDSVREALRAPIGKIRPYTYALGMSESPRGENVHFVMAGEDNTISRLRIRSASYANWPAVPYAVPGNIIADFPLINKSFELCYACCDR